MTAIETISVALRAAIAELDTEISQLAAQRIMLGDALAKLEPAPASEAKKSITPQPKALPPQRHIQPAKCPDCGRECTNGTGLAAHRRHAHPAKRATSTSTFRCSECPYEGSTVSGIADHANDAHKRPATSAERSPVNRAA